MGRFETRWLTTEKNRFVTRRSFRRSFRAMDRPRSRSPSAARSRPEMDRVLGSDQADGRLSTNVRCTSIPAVRGSEAARRQRSAPYTSAIMSFISVQSRSGFAVCWNGLSDLCAGKGKTPDRSTADVTPITVPGISVASDGRRRRKDAVMVYIAKTHHRPRWTTSPTLSATFCLLAVGARTASDPPTLRSPTNETDGSDCGRWRNATVAPIAVVHETSVERVISTRYGITVAPYSITGHRARLSDSDRGL